MNIMKVHCNNSNATIAVQQNECKHLQHIQRQQQMSERTHVPRHAVAIFEEWRVAGGWEGTAKEDFSGQTRDRDQMRLLASQFLSDNRVFVTNSSKIHVLSFYNVTTGTFYSMIS